MSAETAPGSRSRGGRRGAGRSGRRRRRPSILAVGVIVALSAAGLAHNSYVVRPGDNLTFIARRSGTSVGAIARANRIRNPNLIFIGQRLEIPGRTARAPAVHGSGFGLHRIRPGENLYGIALAYGTSVRRLARINGIRNPNMIIAGRTLRVPRAGLPKTEWLLEHYGRRYGVDPGLVKALAWQESGWQQHVVSTAGAVGVMQVMPGTARFTGKYLLGSRVNIHSLHGNVRAGVRFLKYLLTIAGGNERRAIAGYYQGFRSIRRNGLYPSTKRYVANVIALKRRFR